MEEQKNSKITMKKCPYCGGTTHLIKLVYRQLWSIISGKKEYKCSKCGEIAYEGEYKETAKITILKSKKFRISYFVKVIVLLIGFIYLFFIFFGV